MELEEAVAKLAAEADELREEVPVAEHPTM